MLGVRLFRVGQSSHASLLPLERRHNKGTKASFNGELRT
ncbi:hypothetical protein RISK_001562 [Rhodopirellula islandica]|uniref:Uncharacterized protein n=1 Tax=Rhodopirellula islandica TaxID=595434 RepID=A0A0J1BIF1_RHOIS|nr:hypothetical protein RISK_001562 [Rhodopirellula islandica]